MTRAGKCQICRQRKVKCDEVRPTCGPCAVRGRPCSFLETTKCGEDDKLRLTGSKTAPKGAGTFRNFTIRCKIPRSRPAKDPIKVQMLKPLADSHSADAPSSSQAGSDGLEYCATRCGVTKTRQDIDHVASKSLIGSASQKQILGHHMQLWCPRTRQHNWPKLESDLSPRGHAAYTWLPTCYELAFDDPLLADVVLGFALGTLPQSNQYLRQLLYRRAYQRLQLRMLDERSRLSDAVLAAVKFLGFYEGETSIEGCLAHVQGAAALVKARGQLNFASQLSKQLYYANYVGATIVFWYDGGLSTESQKRPPFCAYDDLSEVKLLEIISTLPKAIAAVNNCCKDAAATDRESILAFIDRLDEIKQQLTAWRASTTAPSDWDEPSVLYNDTFPAYLSVRKSFANMAAASQLLMYWTGLLLLEKTKRRLARHAQRLRDCNLNWTQIESDAKYNADRFARTVLQSMEFYCHPDVGPSGIESVEFGASWMAVRVYVKDEGMVDELRWIDLINVMGNRVLGLADLTPWAPSEDVNGEDSS